MIFIRFLFESLLRLGAEGAVQCYEKFAGTPTKSVGLITATQVQIVQRFGKNYNNGQKSGKQCGKVELKCVAVRRVFYDVADAFYAKREKGFVNGLLDAMAKRVRP